MILSKRRNRMVEDVERSLALLRSETGINWINAEFANGKGNRKVENRLNRAFLFCLRNVFQQYTIVQELPIQPKTDTPYSPSEEKKPDFSFFSLELNDDLHEGVYFHIECKRLGSATSRSWNYNEAYVNNGIRRFTTDEFCYGIDRAMGAMVGYIEDMAFEDILMHVNTEIAAKLTVDPLTKHSPDWQEQATTRLGHTFDRPFEKSPFTLHHLWLDLRGCYPRKVPPAA
ncbi:hypothetical protein [Methylovulum psychrotolerans]|uniref:Restriction endonuclease n=1 Tax=Methylovulum psychrotolerans TaxID=1704499 RepID=A0A2S5CQE5_9GAMM|nr:hypothetical protein [Methylovulum psychrotolerans]POZ53006.1 hypothetical protein AADEFJLK_00015 [Methylovulum psychrotolerans]